MNAPRRSPGTRYVLRDDLAAGSPKAIANVVMAFEHGGSVDRAARILDVPSRTLARWLAAFPALKAKVDAVRSHA